MAHIVLILQLLDCIAHKVIEILSFPDFYQPSRGAGHSKWANIKHTKAAKDSERSAQTSKFVNMIKIAIRGKRCFVHEEWEVKCLVI